MMREKNAATCKVTATTRTIQERHYRPFHPLVKSYPRRIFPSRRDRSPARAPASAPRPTPSTDGTALALLVLSLQDCPLTPPQQRWAWRLVEKWLRQLVEARHASEAA